MHIRYKLGPPQLPLLLHTKMAVSPTLYVTGMMFKSNGITSVPKSVPRFVLDKVWDVLVPTILFDFKVPNKSLSQDEWMNEKFINCSVCLDWLFLMNLGWYKIGRDTDDHFGPKKWEIGPDLHFLWIFALIHRFLLAFASFGIAFTILQFFANFAILQFCFLQLNNVCHQFLQYFILYQLWLVDLKHVSEL